MENYETKIETLSLKLDNASEYIKDHHDIKPNLFEITSFMISISELEKVSNKNLENIWTKFDNMTRLYKLDNDNIFNSNEEINRLYSKLYQSTRSRKYEIPIDETEQKIKKELITKYLGIAYFIAESKDNNPSFTYDNKEEYNSLDNLYNTYLNSSKESEFIDDINNIRNYIKENSNFKTKEM